MCFQSMVSTGFRLRLTRDRNERIEGLTEPHQLEVSIDGERLELFTVNPMRVVRLADGVPDDSPTQEQADAGLMVRAAVKAGPHQIQVAFLKKSSALIETPRQPYQARFNNDRHPRIQPALHCVSITGPLQRHRLARPRAASASLRVTRPVRGRSGLRQDHLLRRWRVEPTAVPPPNDDVKPCWRSISEAGPTVDSIMVVELALARAAGQPRVPVPGRARSGRMSRPARRIA